MISRKTPTSTPNDHGVRGCILSRVGVVRITPAARALSRAPSGPPMRSIFYLLVVTVLACAACTSHEISKPQVIKYETPYSSSSWMGQTNLATTPDGKVVLTWLEKVGREQYALRLLVRQAGSWSAPRTITEGNAFVIHWAELPSLVVLPSREWIISWIENAQEGQGQTELKISRSDDQGATWGPPITLLPDQHLADRSFASLQPWSDGDVAAIYLDGRALSRDETPLNREPEVRFTTFHPDGKPGRDAVIDAMPCDCCRPALAHTDRGLIAVYRHRDNIETRDIFIARYHNDFWTKPVPVHTDGWILKGCPLNGPAVSTSGDTVSVAWFTGANAKARVFVAFSDDGGATFGSPVLVSEAFTLGRVNIELVSDNAALVSWLETGNQGATLMARLVMKDGTMGKSFPVSQNGGASVARIPRMVRVGKELLFVWTGSGEPGSLRMASLTPEPQ